MPREPAPQRPHPSPSPSSVLVSLFVLAAGCMVACARTERASATSTSAAAAVPNSPASDGPSAATALAGTRNYQKPPEAVIKQRLTPMQYDVTQNEGTEPPFQNTFWNNHEPGLYVDIVTGEPLFSSLDKYESGTGWPSFTRPVDPARVVTHEDSALGMSRTEVRSKSGDSHLGHVFDDGPAPTGQRFCINSAALRFIPASELVKEGYGDYAPLFRSK